MWVKARYSQTFKKFAKILSALVVSICFVKWATFRPSLKGMNFDCQVPARYRLQSNCALKGSSGKLPQLTRKGGLIAGKSQYNEDASLIQRYFFNRTGGSFIEMGALNGLLYSNSYYFEKFLGWEGLLIEGSPTLFKQLKSNRPDSITLNAMVCAEEKNVHWIDSKNSKNSNSPVGGAYELMPESFRRRWHKSVRKEVLDSYPTVPCKRLGAILETYGITHVDFWTLDVEGAELSVLKTVDFSKFSASVIVIEYRAGSHGVHSYMTKNGYVKHNRIGINDVYLHPFFKKTLQKQKDYTVLRFRR